MKRDGRSETLLSLVDPGRATISIVPSIPIKEVGRLVFTAQQQAMRTSRHRSGGSVAIPLVLPSQSGLRHRAGQTIFTVRQHAVRPISIYCCSFSLYFICFMMIYDDLFVIMVQNVYFI